MVPAIQPPTGPTGEIFRYTLKSTFRDVTELKSIQDWVIDRRLRAVQGVADLTSFGGKTKTYEIKVNPDKLTSLGLTPLDVFTAIQNTNINIGGDMIFENDEAYAVRGIGLINDIDEINNIIIQNNNGVPLLVKDVATVAISNLPRLGWVTRSDAVTNSSGIRMVSDQNDVVECIVVMRKGENPSEVVQELKKEIEKLNRDWQLNFVFVHHEPDKIAIVPRNRADDFAINFQSPHNENNVIQIFHTATKIFRFDDNAFILHIQCNATNSRQAIVGVWGVATPTHGINRWHGDNHGCGGSDASVGAHERHGGAAKHQPEH